MDQWNTPREEKYLGLTPAQFNLAFFAVVGTIGLGIAIYFGAFGALLGSSGGDGSSSGATVVETATPSPAGEASPAPTVTAEEAANSAVLKLSDMPSGWTKDAPDDDGDDLSLSADCEILNADYPPGGLADAESADFEGPEGQVVSSSASAFPSEDAAQEALDTFTGALSRCRDEFVSAFESFLQEPSELSSGDPNVPQEIDISLQDLAFPELGDSSSAYRLEVMMTVEEVSFIFAGDIVFIRAGRMVGGFSYFTFGTANSLEEEVLAETVANKLAEASASLGE